MVNIKDIMHNKKSPIYKIIIYGLLILATVLIDGGYLFLNCLTNTDEFSSIASIMSLAGYDWSSISSGSGYHGFGGIIFLLPIILLFPSINIYKCILVGCLLLRIVCVILTYEISNEILKNDSKKSVLLAILCNVGVLQPDASAALSAMTEVPVTLVTLIFAYLVYLAYKKEKKRIIFLILAGVLAGFASSIHSRIIIMYFSIIICVIITMVIQRKFFKTLIPLTISFVLAYFLTKLLIDNVNHSVYLVADSKELVTSTSSILIRRVVPYLSKIFNPQQVFVIVKTFLAQMGNYTLLTGGIIWVLLLSNVLFIIECSQKARNRSLEKIDLLQFLLVLFGCLNFIVMIISICVSSTGAVLKENYRWYSYLRYSMPYAWIVTLTGFSKLKIKEISTKTFIVTSVIVPTLFIKYILTIICNDLDSSGYNMNYNLFNRIFYNVDENAIMYYSKLSMIILIVLFVICALTVVTKKNIFIYAAYLVISLLVFGSIFNYFITRDKASSLSIDSTIAYINNNPNEVLDNNVYVCGSAKYKYNLQMYYPKIKMNSVSEISIEDDGNYLVFCDRQMKKGDYVAEIRLDDNEFLYIRDDGR